ncbi:O-succinylbenzoic acid--CoA ligase [Bacillus methanolicus PB1]|uniref:2-succinylbenzoate--CoA ligase n=1 Tax=Bacillus methanolicus PB1 TaxID=997296 RepID=I3DYN2_BACMT|nr:o-succinylbenzoate--CoA ligase [Bacillus methanolicus]EIJ79353.1 O-succinylbenzoic acid--CoA ligase [Bacillus methanolicus PB1]
MVEQTIPNWLKKRTDLTPDRIAIHFRDSSITFRELFYLAVKTAGQLSEVGLKKGQFAGVLLRNHQDTVFILLALQMLGIKAVILNNRLTPEEIIWQLNDSHSSFLITEEAFDGHINEITGKINDLPIITKQNLFQKKGSSPEILDEYHMNDVCTVMYTSGTTGHPKGVLQTYGNHWWSAIGSALNLGLFETDTWLCAVPLFHISGYSILVRSMIYGMTIVLHESFDEHETIKDIQKYNVTIMSVVSVMLKRMINSLRDKTFPETFRCMLLGGGPAPLSLLEKCIEKGIPVFQTYGMTETASQIVTLAPEYALSKLGSAGKALFPSEVKIVNSTGEKAAPFEEGEIYVKGPNVTIGYLNQDQGTKDSMQNGWLATGDIGYMDEEGFLYVLDRRQDLIISGGENIYPAEIEGVLLSHPDIIDAGVTGLPDEKWGQIPAAVIVRSRRSKLSEEEVISFCTEKLAKYKVPKKIIFVSELPRNAAKKLLRRKLPNLF